MSSGSHWRGISIEVIAGVVDEVGTEDLSELRRAISKAYPFGERKHWPYKVWCSQVKRTMDQLSGGGRVEKGPPKDIRHFWVQEDKDG